MESFFNSVSSFSYLSLDLAIKSIFIGLIFSLVIIGMKKYLKNSYPEIRYIALYVVLALLVILPILSVSVSINLFDRSQSDSNPASALSSQSLVSPNTPTTNNYYKIKNNTGTKAQHVGRIPNANQQPATIQTAQEQKLSWTLFYRFMPVLFSIAWLGITLMLLYRVFQNHQTVSSESIHAVL